MSTETADANTDETSDNQDDDYCWVVSNDDEVYVCREDYSTYVLSTDDVSIEFDGVRENDDGSFDLKDGHRVQAVVHVTGNVEAILDVLSHEL